MSSYWHRVIVTVFLTVSVLAAGTAFAGSDDLAKQANKIVRNAERKMHSGKNEEAATLLQEASALLEQVKSEDPTNSKISQTEKKLERIQKQVDRKLGRTEVKTSSSARELPKKPQPKSTSSRSTQSATAAQETDSNKLPAGVKRRVASIDNLLDEAEKVSRRSAKRANNKLQEANEIFRYLDKMYVGQFDPSHPEFVVVKNRFDELTKKIIAQGDAEDRAEVEAASAKEAKQKQSAEWVAKFQGYLAYSTSEGHNPAKLVYVPGTSEPEKFADAKNRYEEFKTFYQEYQKTDFPNGKTWLLEDLADKQAPIRLKYFEEGFARRMGSVSERAENEINSAMAQLEKDNGWKSDKSIKPNLLDHRWMTTISEEKDKAISALGASNPKARQIQQSFDALVTKDRENRQIRKERRFMKPDIYTGKDIDALKSKANTLVSSNTKEGGKPLRCTIIAENWREETVHEWTDTSRTVQRWRTTRHQTAQVAAETTSGVQLITVALAQDKQSDGNWGPLYGNLHQGSDPMLASNVNKTGP